jgi:hypothetical protein
MNNETQTKRDFPYPSLLGLLCAVAAFLYLAKSHAPLIVMLGYGIANLGYVLGGAALAAGHFRILGLNKRSHTWIAAVVVWLIGVGLANAA